MRIVRPASLVPGWGVADPIADRAGRATCSGSLSRVRLLRGTKRVPSAYVVCQEKQDGPGAYLVKLSDRSDELVEALVHIDPRLGRCFHLCRAKRPGELQALYNGEAGKERDK